MKTENADLNECILHYIKEEKLSSQSVRHLQVSIEGTLQWTCLQRITLSSSKLISSPRVRIGESYAVYSICLSSISDTVVCIV